MNDSQNKEMDLVEEECKGDAGDYDFDSITPKYYTLDQTQESVCGIDSRSKVTGTTAMPYKAICKLYMRTKTGRNLIGSGWLTHSNKLYTAGHCVYDHDEGGWMDSIIVVPAKSGNSEPYGRYEAQKMYATDGWINSRSKRFDMGAIKLSSNVSHSDYLIPSLGDVDSATVCGYPGDRDTGIFQYKMRDAITKTNDRFFYSIDTFGGQSGCPLLKNATHGIGIHNYGGCDNSASDLYRAFIDKVNSW